MRRFSVDEYHRLGDAGILAEDDRVELLAGWIVPKMIHNPRHDGTIGLIDRRLRAEVPVEWIIRIQSAITTADSEPEPDLVVARGPVEQYLGRHPQAADLALVVEVADTSLARDRAKCAVYGAAGVADYWIIDLADRRVEVYTQPTGPADQPGYGRRDDRGPNDLVELALPGSEAIRVAVRGLLPP